MYMIAYLGESLTTGRKPNLTAFHRKLGDWFGIHSKDIAGLAANFYYETEVAAKFLKEPPRHGDIMEIWRVLNGMDCLSVYINDCFMNRSLIFIKHLNIFNNSTFITERIFFISLTIII